MIAPESRIPRNTPERLATNYTNSHEIFSARQWVYAPRIVSGAKPGTPKGSSRTAQGASPGFKVLIAESPERAAQGFGLQLQINARHKAPALIPAPLHRPFGAFVVALLVPRACALGFSESPL